VAKGFEGLIGGIGIDVEAGETVQPVSARITKITKFLLGAIVFL
jgi:hypothetical protein